MKTFPKRTYLQVDPNADSNEENLLAWRSLDAAENGQVGVYELVETLSKRESVEIRRKGSKTWFKSSSALA